LKARSARTSGAAKPSAMLIATVVPAETTIAAQL
jgi:hypothetical protein